MGSNWSSGPPCLWGLSGGCGRRSTGDGVGWPAVVLGGSIEGCVPLLEVEPRGRGTEGIALEVSTAGTPSVALLLGGSTLLLLDIEQRLQRYRLLDPTQQNDACLLCSLSQS